MKNKEKPSVFVLSRSTPPRSGGTPSILANQLAWLDYNFIFMGTMPKRNEWRNVMKPNWHFYGIPPIHSHRFIPGYEWLWIFQIISKGLRAIKKHKCQSIILLLLEERYIFSGYIISLISRLPLIFYVQDLYADGKTKDDGFFNRKFANWLEKSVIKKSKYHITNVPGLVGYYRRKWSVDMKLISNCYPPDLVLKSYRSKGDNKYNSDFIIGFCGSVYWHNVNNLKKLCIAASKISNSRLAIFGSQSPEYLKKLGITGVHISQEYYPNSNDLQEALSKCDVLYFPFTFDPKYKLSMINAFPTKVHNYLSCGRPILVNCPSDCYLSKYFGSNGAAMVVNRDSPSELLKALIQLKEDKDYVQQIVQNASRVAKSYAGSKPVYELKMILLEVGS